MQTFLTNSDFHECAKVLDDKRIWKQTLEADGLIRIIKGERTGYRFHKITRMWWNYLDALTYYRNCILLEWLGRRLNNQPKLVFDKPQIMPHWIDNEKIFSSHRAALLYKNYDHYKQFGWKEKPELRYVYDGLD